MPLQWLFRVSKVTDLDLQRWAKENRHHDLIECCETPFKWFSEKKAEEYYVKDLMPYATKVENIAYYYNYNPCRTPEPAYVVNLVPVAHWNTSWRDDPELLNVMKGVLSPKVLEDNCYYLCNEDMLNILYDDLIERGIEPDFDPKNGENEHLVYCAWGV